MKIYFSDSIRGGRSEAKAILLRPGLLPFITKKIKTTRFLIVFGLIMSLVSCADEKTELGEKTSFEITSEHAGATYTVDIRLPVNYDASETYETVYTLDPDWYFDHTSKESARLSEETGKRGVIIAGISHGNPRTTDYMPTTTSQGDGGAENFTRFLQNELIPYMEEHFSSDTTRSSRAVLGHSAGGLYAAYAFTMHNDLFGNYLMLSPAIWYDDGICLEYESENRSSIESSEQIVFISKAELEATQLFATMFYDRLENYENTDVAIHKIKGKDHASSAKSAITEGLSFYYHLKEN